MYLGSPDNKDFCSNKHISNYFQALISKNYNSIAFGVIISVLYLGVFTMILPASFRTIFRPCKSVFHSPYIKTLHKSICLRIKQHANFHLYSLSIKSDILAKFVTPQIAFFYCSNLILES